MTKSSRQRPDVIALLKADHAEVKKLFADFKNSDDQDEKSEIAERICQMLTVHAACEEELVYPAAREVLDDPTLIPEAEVEHETAKNLIAQIEDGSADDERFDALVTVLGEYIDHHVKEEEGEIFPKMKAKGLDVMDLGAAVQARKAELMAELGTEEDSEDEGEEEEDEDEEEETETGGGRRSSQLRREEIPPSRGAKREVTESEGGSWTA